MFMLALFVITRFAQFGSNLIAPLTGIMWAFGAGVSSEMLMASYNQAIPLTSGSTISGYLQSLLWIASVMTPLGFIGMQAKKIYSFHRKASKQKFFEQTRGLRDTGRPHSK